MTVSTAFAKNLKEKLCAFYGGRMPSFSTTARDFALRSPHLKHVSSETIRKWVRGSSLPTVERLRVLNEWFQCDLMLETKHASDQSNDSELIPYLILQLNQQDKNLICRMIQTLSNGRLSAAHSSSDRGFSINDRIDFEHTKLKNLDTL